MKILLLLALTSAALIGCSNDAQVAACRADLQCRAEKFSSQADIFCMEQIKKQANTDLKWEQVRDWQLLSKYEWKDKAKGTIAYYGDKAEFQTATGAYEIESYECDVDPDKEKAPVIALHFKPGKLPS